MERGICKFNIVPVRSEPAHRSELVTQLLFGDYYSITEMSEDGRWAHIKVDFDGYEGWIDFKQHLPFLDIYQKDTSLITSEIGLIKGGGVQMLVPAGSFIPKLQKGKIQLTNLWYHFDGAAKDFNRILGYNDLKIIAQSYLGTPYLWGGKSHFGIDCSGFVQQVLKICGYSLMRDAWQQADQGIAVKSLGEVKPGDIAFFANEKGRVVHVGLILEEFNIIHAHGEVRIDTLDEKGIFNKNINGYSHELCLIKRILVET